MTEAEWLTGSDPRGMLALISERASQRKLRLFAVACFRLIWDLIEQSWNVPPNAPIRSMRTHEQLAHQMDRLRRDSCRSLELAENYADGRGMVSDLEFISEHAYTPVANLGYTNARSAARFAEETVRQYLTYIGSEPRRHENLLRDIFGNPFRPVALDPAWLTTDVVALARGIYDERAFDRMPILADALQDAGCTNEDVLIHCRNTNQIHVRGCWVVDLVLGKT